MAGFSSREAFLSVDIEDLDDFRRALTRADREIRRGFDKAIRGFAGEVRDDARARYRGTYIQRSGRSVKGITSAASFGTAALYINRSGQRPWLIGQDWGGGSRPTTRQFPPWGREGRFGWPAYMAGSDKVTDQTVELIETAVAILVGRR